MNEIRIGLLTRRGALRAVCVAAALAGAGIAHANDAVQVGDDGDPQIVVRYDDLNVGTEAGARALLRRIETAARHVCPSDKGIRDLRFMAEARTCRDDAVAHALARIPAGKLAVLEPAAKPLG
jgi:UrcA family protein